MCGPDCPHRPKLDANKLHRFHYIGGRLHLIVLNGLTVRILDVTHGPACVNSYKVQPVTGAPDFVAYADELTPIQDTDHA